MKELICASVSTFNLLLHHRDYTRPELPSGDNEAGASSAHTSVPDITAALAGELIQDCIYFYALWVDIQLRC